MASPALAPVPGDVTLFMGLGAPKCGTTSLYERMRAHPDCHLRAVKELHYFDSLASGTARGRGYIESVHRRLDRQRKRTYRPSRRLALRRDARDHSDWLGTFDGTSRDDAAYLGYLCHGWRRQRVVGEITPDYAALGPDWLRAIRDVAPDVRAVLVLRDPVARLLSHVRMAAGRLAPGQLDETAIRMARETLDGQHRWIARFSDYRRIVTQITSVFPQNRLHLEFFERLFTRDALSRIGAFLGIAPLDARPRAALHQGIPVAFPPDLLDACRGYLEPQYDFAREYFGDRLPESWRADVRATS